MKFFVFVIAYLCFALSSCKINQLDNFKPITISKISVDDALPKKDEDFFIAHTKWILKAVDSISIVNQTIRIDTLQKERGILDYSLHIHSNQMTIKDKKHINYQAEVAPLLNKQKHVVAFGLKSDRFFEIDSFYEYKNQFKKGFDNYFNINFFGQIIPWKSYLKPIYHKKNALTFSLNKVAFKRDVFSKPQKIYFKRIVNNSFVKNTERNNKRVQNLQKERNQFFLNFYNNTRRLFNVKTDYSVDMSFSESVNKDSIYLDLKYYSKKNKEVNLLIPEVLKTRYSFDKHSFDLANHIDANIEINRIVSIFIGNNQFIRYGAFE